MIKFEYGMLVLDNNTTKDDVKEIDAFAEYVRNQETERIFKLLETEQQRTKLGFIQYQRIQELIEENK
jgi:hypothetical protein